MKRRKLITRECYERVNNLHSLGVPLSKLVREFDLDISRPSLDKLLRMHKELFSRGGPEIQESLAPPWMDQYGDFVQEQPEDWKYEGYFPLGSWQHADY